jgi:magnesium-transporting ATPase (P-type)
MLGPPESPQRPIVTRALAGRTFLFFGIIEATLGLAAYVIYYLSQGWNLGDSFAPYADIHREATTATFLAIVGGQVGCLFAQRDGTLPQRLSLRSNRWIALGLCFELAVAPALVYTPLLNRAVQMAPVAPQWLAVVPAAAGIFLLFDLVRRALPRPVVSGSPAPSHGRSTAD